MALVNSKKKTKQNLKKKVFTSKLWELRKTRTKKSKSDILNCYVVSANRDMMDDTDKSTTCKSKFRGPPIQKIQKKKEVLPETWASPNNRLNISDQKRDNFVFGIRDQNKVTTKTQRKQLKMDLVTKKK